MKKLSIILLLAVFAASALVSMAQGVVVFKKGGGRVVFPYEEIDSIVTYNYDETPPGSGGTAFDGEKKVVTVNGVSFTMLPVAGGAFSMGATSEQYNGYSPSDNEKPVHTVTVSSFYMAETEVTQALWYAVMGAKPTSDGSKWSNDYGLGDNYPAYNISYNDCLEFISKLNDLTDITFRMPTEAEWEYAARGGNISAGYIFSGSNTPGDVAWYLDNSGSKTHPVKTKNPNELGLYDMSGNVYEWCSDWYGAYDNSDQTDPTGPVDGSRRVLRGGSWSDRATYGRVANRNNFIPSSRSSNYGLRLVSL